jgi:DNA primase
MLSQSTIDQVNDLPLDQVISKYVALKKQGSQLTGKSPFTEEKTGSFQVSMSKGCWKCFSSGKGGGNGISFVMEKTGATFVEAIKELAQDHGIALEYNDSEKSKAYLARAEKVRTITDINSAALEYFISNTKEIPQEKRRANETMYDRFSLGYAPNEWAGLMNHLLSKGYSQDQLIRAGLIVKSEDGKKCFDFFRGRIVFPIFSASGKVLGFSGRNIIDKKNPDDREITKVINSKETDAYNKSNSILGIYQAKAAIIQMGFACLVEGNFDVTSLHQVGMENTIAPLGTAFTKEQAKIIRKFTDTIALFIDNDKAGRKDIEKNTIMLLENGFKVYLFIPINDEEDSIKTENDPDHKGLDPDDYIQKNDWTGISFLDHFNETKRDAIEYLTDQYFKNAKSVVAISTAETNLTKLLSYISDAALRNSYIKHFAKSHKIERASVEKAVSVEISIRNNNPLEDPNEKKHRLPSHLKEEDQDNFKEHGFYEDHIKEKIGYYFPAQGVGFERISNFTIKPFFQIRKTENSKRIVELKNPYGSKVIEISNKAFVSAPMFEEIVMNYGNYNFTGSKKQYQRIRTKLLDQFPICDEITTLGWQSKGFYAFANGIVDGNFRKVDDYGICHYGDEQFFLPAFSKIYKDAQEEDDMYEADRFFQYKPSGITMAQWTAKMIRVHGENGMWSALHVIASIYRDFIFSINNYFPILFNFGLPQTGKSTCARSVNSIFFGQQAAFLLPSGTPVSFNRRLARVKNAVVWFDEYTNNIDERRFQSLKGSYDGTGHEKGVMSNDNKTIATKINSAPVISGQFLPTRDGNSLFTRCMILYFTVKPEDRTIEDAKEFDELNEWERKGLSDLIIETVKFRDYFVNAYPREQFEMNSRLKNDLQNEDFEGRVMQNWSLLMTIAKLMIEKLHLPFTMEEVYKSGLQNIVKQSEQIGDSNDLAGFWKMVEYLSFQSLIRVTEDYIIRKETSIKVREGRGKDLHIDLGAGENVLYIRFTKVHALYMENHRKQTGENGVPEQSLKSYLKANKTFLGSVAVVNFDGQKSSAYAFKFDMLGIALKGWNDDHQVTQQEVKPTVSVLDTAQEDLPF